MVKIKNRKEKNTATPNDDFIREENFHNFLNCDQEMKVEVPSFVLFDDKLLN